MKNVFIRILLMLSLLYPCTPSVAKLDICRRVSALFGQCLGNKGCPPPILGEYAQGQKYAWDNGKATYLAYTRGGADGARNLKTYLLNPDNWFPERVAIHQNILKTCYDEARALAMTLHPPSTEPVLVLTRGNSGSGKTFVLTHTDNSFLKGLNLEGAVKEHESGVINPDIIKTQISRLENGHVSSAQVHEEGSMLADQVVIRLIGEKTSFILDKRFGTAEAISKVAQKAKENGYRVVVIDVDAPVETSSQ